MKALNPLFAIAYIVWSISAIVFIVDMACWFFDTDAWYTNILAGMSAFFVLALPFGAIAVCALLFYYLAFVQDWNIWLTIFYMFPGLLFALVGTLSELVGTIFSKKS